MAANDNINDGTLRPMPDNETQRWTPDGGTMRPASDGGTMRPAPDGGTMRPAPDGGTMRPAPDGGTMRPASDGGTMRPAADGGTMRPAPDGGTMRPAPDGGTMRPAPDGGTKRPAPQRDGASKTFAKPQRDSQSKPYTSHAPKADFKRNEIKPSDIETFVLNGVTYHVEGIISNSTGEAVVYKLTNGGRVYALKLYYYGIIPDSKVLKALEGARGTGFLVDIIESGVWTSPSGEQRHYELQPYYAGGDLVSGSLYGQPEALKTAALSMLMAIKTAHDHQLLHRDIKPSNFMYKDQSRTQMVLCDFGIASLFELDSKGKMRPLKTRAQFRTKIYAAPETYTVIDREIEYDDVKSDYYSLGMTLLTLWMGEAPFNDYDERTLLRMKKGESGTLPMDEGMPAELTRLIKGLLVPNPDKRWGFDEFERWVRGEYVEIEGEEQPVAGLNILYSGSQNLVAQTFEELVSYMLQDKKLAKQYLYSGKISRWIADAQYPELVIQIDEFINKTYPKDQEAGLMAVCYLLDGNLSFIGPLGDKLETMEDIAHDMVMHAPDYLDYMAEKNSPLYVYFRASGLNYADDFVKVAKEKTELHALWRMVFTLNPNESFPLLNPENDCYYPVDTIEELVDYFAGLGENPYHDSHNVYPELLEDEAFLMWLGHRSPMLEGVIRSKLQQEDMDMKAIYYYIFYLLAPDRNYFMQKDQSKAFTMAQIAEMLDMDMMITNANDMGYPQDANAVDAATSRIDMMTDIIGTRMYYYIKSKEVYKQQLDYIDYVMDFESEDNSKKPGPYNEYVAMYKLIKAFSGKVHYFFPQANVTVSSVEELSKISKDELIDEMDKGNLLEWLTVQYHEDPHADLSVPFAYETLLAQYTEKMGELDSDYSEYSRYLDAKKQVADNAVKCKRVITRVKALRGLWGLLVALPLLVVFIGSFWPGYAHFDNPDKWYAYLIIVPVIAVVYRVIQAWDALGGILQYSFSVKAGNYLERHKWQCAFAYSAVALGMIYVLQHWGDSWGCLVPAIICAAIAYGSYAFAIKDLPLMEKTYDDAINPDVESSIVEPVLFAWADKAKEMNFDSETIDRQKLYIDSTKNEAKTLFWRTIFALGPVLTMVGVYILTSQIRSDYIKEHNPQSWERIYGNGSAKVVETATPDYELYYADVRSTLTVRNAPSTTAAPLGVLNKNQQMEVIGFENGFAKINYNGGVGYVSASYIKPVNGDSETLKQTQEQTQEQTQKQTQKQTEKQAQQQAEPEQEEVIESSGPIYEVVDEIPYGHNSSGQIEE